MSGNDAERDAVPVFFLSDSTGISAEIMGRAILLQFPQRRFDPRQIPFIVTPEDARRVVEQLDAVLDSGVTPVVFSTAASADVREVLLAGRTPIVDLFDAHLSKVEEILGEQGVRQPGRLHGVRDLQQYNRRMAAIDFAIEHDDGASVRDLERADVVLIAPSRCGKTPTSMYLALQYGLNVANYPLVEEDLERSDLPGPVRGLSAPVFGLMTTPERLHQVRSERRPNSRYSSLDTCRAELRAADRLYTTHRVTVIDSSNRSVEEMSTVVVQQLRRERAGLVSGPGSAGVPAGAGSRPTAAGAPSGTPSRPRPRPRPRREDS